MKETETIGEKKTETTIANISKFVSELNGWLVGRWASRWKQFDVIYF